MPAQQKKQKEKTTVVERTVKAIQHGIKEGSYAPGQRLIEAELTKSLGVSRGPLREALYRLAGEGLVVIEPNRGVSVRRLTQDEVADIFAIREMLEGLAAKLAAKNIQDSNAVKSLKSVMKDMEKHYKSQDIAEYIQTNERFHDAIVTLSGNKQLAGLLAQLRIPLFRTQFKRLFYGHIEQSMDDHLTIYNAVIDGDASGAERAMRRHIRNSSSLSKKEPGQG